jgi:catechol 2,3-dioxygenase-like lactoylglutathione lyase family enzyme
MPPAASQLNHVALHVADVEQSVVFYRDVLGLTPIGRPAFSFPGAWFLLGKDQELHLIGGRHQEVHSHNRGNHFALLVSGVSEFEAWEQYLTQQQVRFDPRRTRPDGALQLYVIDPDGHYIEICTPPVATT